jgi:hypothetical protein
LDLVSRPSTKSWPGPPALDADSRRLRRSECFIQKTLAGQHFGCVLGPAPSSQGIVDFLEEGVFTVQFRSVLTCDLAGQRSAQAAMPPKQ